MDIINQLAKMIDHSLLHPTMTDTDLRQGCDIARQYGVASVCIKPYAVAAATKWLAGSDVLVGTVIGFPHGNSLVSTKVAETLQACRDGATEIDMVVNIGKVLQQDWEYVRQEIRAVTETCHREGAIVKVIFENDYLPDDSYKIKLCEICSEAGADFVKTSTGYGFVKGTDGRYSYDGATEHDLKLMRRHSAPEVQVKAAGGVRTLDDLLKVREWGVTRVGATATIAMLEEAKSRFGDGSTSATRPVVPDNTVGY
ncbi:deoxyribose-phosphate aldolase [Telluribacter sp.]|jgi:deoxyribose-phosphate aldolase|uniref:deoxyribose-phosphate aldolase n=1 Tax=Telluribacter sp. TaxID=1978767 RepID=UPI002E144CC7|nr:deoxyribose-phosphate aldolase [Telluribacter sp.]